MNHCVQINSYLNQKFGLNLTFIIKQVEQFNPNIKVASDDQDIQRILSLRQVTYTNHLTEINYGKLEHIDFYSLIFYSEDEHGNVVSSCRLTFENRAVGFAEDYVYNAHIQNLRDLKKKFVEWGRCISLPNSDVRAEDYARLVKHIAQPLGIDFVVFFNRVCDVKRITERLENSKVLCHTDITLGSKEHTFTAMIWSIQADELNITPIYQPNVWESYAQCFMTVTTHFQSSMLRAAAQQLFGDVIDCGAGCAKLAPYLKYQDNITSYTGIDASREMSKLGQQVLNKVARDKFTMVNKYINEFQTEQHFDSAVSINSLYTWNEPITVLKHINSFLQPNGVFVLATINSDIDMPKLALQAEADLIAHPDVDVFREMNLSLAANTKANLLSLDALIQLVHQAKFQVIECHNQFYDGGVSFLVLKKSA